MSAPFTGNIIGSWLFIRGSKPDFTERIIYHFCNDGKTYWEVDNESKRILASLKYKFSADQLTLIYSSGSESTFTLTQEDDGSVRIPNKSGEYTWWMVRLDTPKDYSIAFVDSSGHLIKLNTTEQGAAANP
jgi:hypothetical protein